MSSNYVWMRALKAFTKIILMTIVKLPIILEHRMHLVPLIVCYRWLQMLLVNRPSSLPIIILFTTPFNICVKLGDILRENT